MDNIKTSLLFLKTSFPNDDINYSSSRIFINLTLDARTKLPLAISLSVMRVISMAGIAPLTDEQVSLYFTASP